jgi:WW domain-binding protein 2
MYIVRMSKTKRIRSHLCSWVMLAPQGKPPFTFLPNEQNLHTSTPRISFNLQTPNNSSQYPGNKQTPFHLSSPSGVVYLTNRRIIFLPDKSTPQLQSFAAPILSLHDSHVAAPWFGPNVWTALLQPTQGGGIPTPSTGVVEVKFTFKEGGAFDFHTQYERIRERLQQAVETQRLDGDTSSRNGVNGVDINNVNLEDLPAYQEETDGPLLPPIASAVAAAQENVRSRNYEQVNGDDGRNRRREDEDTPIEPPPGYEEAQMASLRDEVERRLEREGQ